MHPGTASANHLWAIVLAGGEGTRLRSLTADQSGNAIPKQFCSLDGGASLLMQTVARARSIVRSDRITCIVSAEHSQYWRSLRDILSPHNVVSQPANRGTGVGILLPTLRILERDPAARILILPSDHYVADEPVLAEAMSSALEAIRWHALGVALLGIQADDPDPELGYIVPCERGHATLYGVERFVEKPALEEARRLCDSGALWNSFIVACRAQSLIDLYMSRCSGIVEPLQAQTLHDDARLLDLYRTLPPIDFSRHVAVGQERQLTVMPVPRCGWNDLGTPHRLAQTLARKHAQNAPEITQGGGLGAHINLAERLMHVHPTMRQVLTSTR